MMDSIAAASMSMSQMQFQNAYDIAMVKKGMDHNGRYDHPAVSEAKKAVVDRLFSQYGKDIVYGTARGAGKVDIFLWKLVK